MKFLRTQLEPALGQGRTWQHQSYDHVLREEQRRRNAFGQVCFYILENPVRAKFVKSSAEWEFHGAVLPGYPSLHPLAEDFWEIFWKLYIGQQEAESLPVNGPTEILEKINQ